MNKLVYLFELDSVRNADDQMEQAMRALYREIVMHGNAVAITFNQLIDSRFFLSLLNDDRWSDDILKLFHSGAIRISQFGKFRTPSQYLISQALDSSEEYIFSGLPIRSNQKSLIALAKRSLMYSDMTELNEYISGQRSWEERRKLFREQNRLEANGKPEVLIQECNLNNPEILNTLRDLRAVLNLILQFSNIQNAYNPPKDYDAVEQNLTMYDYIKRAEKFVRPDIPEWNDALAKLNEVLCMVGNKNKRSEVLKTIFREYQNSEQTDKTFRIFSLAESIVNLCYNYACEASISNVSRHYSLGEFQNNSGQCDTFCADFIARLQQYYGNDKRRKDHFLVPESNDFKPYQFKKRWFCNLKRAVHLSEYALVYPHKTDSDERLFPYEYRLVSQSIRNRGRLLWGVGKKISLTLVYLLIAFFIENKIYALLEDLLDHYFEAKISGSVSGWLTVTIAAFLSAALVEWLSGKLSKLLSSKEDYTRQQAQKNKKRLRVNLPTFGDCLESFISQLGDAVCALISFGAPYFNRDNAGKMQPTKREAVKRISHISKTVSDYRRYKDELSHDKQRAWMFSASDRMPLVDIQEDEDAVRLTQIEELTGKTFGIAYRSPYHIMVVDPVRRSDIDSAALTDNDIYSYERLAQNADQPGIITIPILRKQDKPHFVLLKQYRHAIRREQLCFPRGFGENGIPVFNNAQRELWEEIRAVLRDPNSNVEIHYSIDPDQNDDPTPALKELGRITTDSGSQCDTVIIVQAELASYDAQNGHEGIIDSIEVDAEELRSLIRSHQIDDSFTIQAFMLWSEA